MLDVSAVMGLCAMVVVTINILLGMMLSTAYKKANLWKRLPEKIKMIDINDVHNWTAYVALCLVFLHIIFLVLDPKTKFG